MTVFRRYLKPLIITCAMTGGLVWAASAFFNARDTAARASTDLASCRLAAARIQQLDQLPRGQGSGPLDPTTLYKRGQEALQALQLPPDHLSQIAPGAPQRVGETAYKEVPTAVTLRDVNLRQVIRILLAITDNSSLTVKSLRLSSPRDSEDGARWTAEVTLSHLIYETPAVVRVTTASERN